MPPWLRDVPLPPHPVAPEQARPAPGESALPDWLRGLQSSANDEASATPADASTHSAMDWLAGSDAPAAPAAAAPEPDQPMPDWLRELASTMPEAEEAPKPPPAAPAPRPTPRVEGATSWLESMARPGEAALPAAPEPPAAPPARPLKRMPSGATDWLRSLGQEPDPQVEPPRRVDPPPQPQRPTNAAKPPSDDGVPSWLRDINEEELARDLAASAAEPAAPEAPGHASGGDAELEMPSWLATPDEHPGRPTASRSEPAIPSWLHDAAGEREESDEERGTHRDQDEDEGDVAIPDWLRTVRDDDVPTNAAETAPGPAAPSWLQGAPPKQPEIVEPATPSWLDSASTAPDAIPAWLRDSEHDAPEAAGADDAPTFSQNEAPAEATIATGADDHLPDWLRVEETPAAQQPAQADDDDVPLWMRSDTPNTPGSFAAPGDNEPTPDWLNTLEPEAAVPPAADVDDVPPWLR
ncbi:MAG: hypothetical protein H7Y32_16475, partial [Chloroflexales bacterium]|nr:hypothetical protein [Chloroflexales bacterium]